MDSAEQSIIPLAERAVTAVRLRHLDFSAEPPVGSVMVGFTCEIQFQAYDGHDDGPAISVHLGVPTSSQMTLEELERLALNRTRELLAAMAKVSEADLAQVFYAGRSKQIAAAKQNATYRQKTNTAD